MIKKEQPDLIVISGDTVAPDNVDPKNFAGKWQSALESIIATKTPYVATGGTPSAVDPATQVSIDRKFGGDFSWTGYKWNLGNTRVIGDENDIGFFTSRIPIMDHSG